MVKLLRITFAETGPAWDLRTTPKIKFNLFSGNNGDHK